MSTAFKNKLKVYGIKWYNINLKMFSVNKSPVLIFLRFFNANTVVVWYNFKAIEYKVPSVNVKFKVTGAHSQF